MPRAGIERWCIPIQVASSADIDAFLRLDRKAPAGTFERANIVVKRPAQARVDSPLLRPSERCAHYPRRQRHAS